MTKAWSKVKEWASNYRWDVAAAGLADAILGTGEVIIGGTAVTLGCATVVFCGAAIAGGYAMVDGGSRIVSGAADIIGANDPDYQQGSYNILKNRYVAVLGPDLGGFAYDLAGVAATAGAAFGVAYAKSGLVEMEAAATKPKGPPLETYEVGTYRDLDSRSRPGDGLPIHHVPQKLLAQDLVPGYPALPADDAPATALPSKQRYAISGAQKSCMAAYRRGEIPGPLSALDLLDRDNEVLRTHTNGPESALQRLIQLNKQLYGLGKD